MISSDALRFPFLGIRKGGEPFEYLLMDINYEKADIAIFKWMVSHMTLKLNERVDLFLPIHLSEQYDARHNISGFVSATGEEPLEQAYLYEISFDQNLRRIYPNNNFIQQFTENLSIDINLVDLLFKLVKDSIILKQSLLVYLKHLAPYFSRIVNYPIEDYEQLKNFVFGDIVTRIKANEGVLNSLYQTLVENVKNIHDVSIYLNLEELRETMESEINLDLFLIAFTEQATGVEIMDLLTQPEEYTSRYRDYFYATYLFAIKTLEKRLYSNYNQIVLIYMRSITAIV